jgi:hypothetical protein
VRRRLGLLVALSAVLAGLPAPGASAKAPPHIKHVFVVVLENTNYSESFGRQSDARYLKHRLVKQGELLKRYYAIGHLSLVNYIAMISGQAPNPSTQSDCQIYTDVFPGLAVSDGQVLGTGCVYPNGVETVANQLEGAGYTWKGYMEDMNAGTPKGEPEVTCRHPSINSADDTQSAEVGDQYAARHNPFVYFHQIIDFKTCDKHDVDFKHLRHDLKRNRTTPNYSFITPNLCHDGHDEPCVNGKPGGLKTAQRWLRRQVRRIRHSPAYRDRGLIIVTFDEAEAAPPESPEDWDASACCNEQPGPNTPNPGGIAVGPGGGRIGTVLLSPCIRPHTINKDPYNHYSMLRWVEDNFDLPHLGYAGQHGLQAFDSKVLNKRRC